MVHQDILPVLMQNKLLVLVQLNFTFVQPSLQYLIQPN